MPTSAPPTFTPPHTHVIDGFVIETYPSIAHTPFANIPPPSTPSTPSLPHCLLCLRLPSPPDLLVPCDNCPRIYHHTCLTPLLRPHLNTRRPFICPPCTQTTNHLHHRRATAVASLRRFHHHLAAFPCLPPKLSLKALNLPPPAVEAMDVSPPAPVAPLPIRLRHPATLPPKRRLRSRHATVNGGRAVVADAASVPCRKVTLFKRVSPASLARRRRSIAAIGCDVGRVVQSRDHADLMQYLCCAKDYLTKARAVRVEDAYIKVVHVGDAAEGALDAEQRKEAGSDRQNMPMP